MSSIPLAKRMLWLTLAVILAVVALAAPAEATTVTLFSTPNIVVQGQQVTITAGPNLVSAIPTGSITFTFQCAAAGSTPSTLSAALDATGYATLQIPASAPTFCIGNNSIVAAYGGDSNYTAGQSAPSAVTVLSSFAPTSMALNSSLNPSTVGQSVTFSAILTYTAVVVNNLSIYPTGTVTFTDTTTGNVIGTGPVIRSGTGAEYTTGASFTTSSLAVGLHAIQASYPGDNIYGPSTSSVNQTVNGPSTVYSTTASLTVPASPTTIIAGQSITFTALVSSNGGGTPTGGTVTFTDGTTTLLTVALNTTTGAASMSTSSLAVGTHSVTATYNGSGSFAASAPSSPVTVVVQPAPLLPTTTALTLIPPTNPATAPALIGLTATVAPAPPNTGTPTGMVTFQDGSAQLGTAQLANGVAALPSSVSFAAGTHQLSATYSGDLTFAGSQGTYTEVVNTPVPILTTTTTVIISSVNPSLFGQAVTFTAIVTGTLPTGSITFTAGSITSVVNLPSPASSNSATVMFITSALPVGNSAVSAAYSGDAGNLASVSTTLTQTVNQASTTTALASSLNPSVAGQTVTFTATVTVNQPGAGTPASTVSFVADGATVLCAAVTLSNGKASCGTSALPVGSHTIVAVYSGGTNFLPSSASLAQNVTMSPTVTGADLVTNVTADDRRVSPGDGDSYMITVTNKGPSNASAVVVTDVLPPGVLFRSLDVNKGSCMSPAQGQPGSITCTLASLPASTSLRISINVKIKAPVGSTIVNSASVTSSTPDPNLSNNTSSVTIRVTADN